MRRPAEQLAPPSTVAMTLARGIDIALAAMEATGRSEVTLLIGGPNGATFTCHVKQGYAITPSDYSIFSFDPGHMGEN